jgi:hypothetical protein
MPSGTAPPVSDPLTAAVLARPLSRRVPYQRHEFPYADTLATVARQAWRERVQFVVVLQIAEQGTADRATLAAIVPGAEQHDLTDAVEDLLDDGLLQRPSGLRDSIDNLVAHGRLLLTSTGRRWLDATSLGPP